MVHESPNPDLASGRPCGICGYALEGLEASGLCPECGHTESTARAALLAGGRRLHLGAKLVQGAILCGLLAGVLVVGFMLLVTRVIPNASSWWETVVLFIAVPIVVAIPCLAIAGVWNLTSDPSGYGVHAKARLIARGALVLSIAALFVGEGLSGRAELLWGIVAAGMAVAAGVGMLALERVRSGVGERLGVGDRVRPGFFGKALMVFAALLILSVPVRVVQHLVGGSTLVWEAFSGGTAWLLLLGLLYQANMFVYLLRVAGIVRDPTAVPTAEVPTVASAPTASGSGAGSGD